MNHPSRRSCGLIISICMIQKVILKNIKFFLLMLFAILVTISKIDYKIKNIAFFSINDLVFKPHALFDASLQIFHLVQHFCGYWRVSIRHDALQLLSQFVLFVLILRQKQHHIGQRVRSLIKRTFRFKNMCVN